MPLKLRPPRKGKTPNFEIRGTHLRVRVETSSGTDRRSLARKRLRQIEECIEQHGQYPAPAPKHHSGEPTFLSAANKYLQDGANKRYVARLIKHFSEMLLSEIDQEAIDDAALTLYPNFASPARNRAVHTPVSAILHHAGVEITVKRPKGYKGKQKTLFLLPEDAFAIIDAADQIDAEMGRLLRFLLYTGCRIGEALNLQWDWVDLDQRVAYIDKSKNDDPRTVKLRPDLCALLEPHRKPSGKVFRFHQGGHRNFLFLNAKVTASGLPPVQRPKKGERMVIPPYRFKWVTFHTFCHTWATWMRRYSGADLQGLVATGRWRDLRSAARYTHTAASAEWDRVDSLPAMPSLGNFRGKRAS
jgi:integrase